MIANVGSKWDDGKLVFFNRTSGTTIATFDPDNDVLNIKALQLDGTDIAQVANQADSVATDAAGIVSDFNDLLDKFKAAGLMVADAE